MPREFRVMARKRSPIPVSWTSVRTLEPAPTSDNSASASSATVCAAQRLEGRLYCSWLPVHSARSSSGRCISGPVTSAYDKTDMCWRLVRDAIASNTFLFPFTVCEFTSGGGWYCTRSSAANFPKREKSDNFHLIERQSRLPARNSLMVRTTI
jgi:hypothetical protein